MGKPETYFISTEKAFLLKKEPNSQVEKRSSL